MFSAHFVISIEHYKDYIILIFIIIIVVVDVVIVVVVVPFPLFAVLITLYVMG